MKTSSTIATSPAIAAAPTTRTAGSRRSVPSPKTTTVAMRARTPLPTSSQLTLIIGASTSKPKAPVALSRRCQAIQLTRVVMPATTKRRRARAQGQAARAAVVSTPATMADTYVTDTLYTNGPPPCAAHRARLSFVRAVLVGYPDVGPTDPEGHG